MDENKNTEYEQAKERIESFFRSGRISNACSSFGLGQDYGIATTKIPFHRSNNELKELVEILGNIGVSLTPSGDSTEKNYRLSKGGITLLSKKEHNHEYKPTRKGLWLYKKKKGGFESYGKLQIKIDPLCFNEESERIIKAILKVQD
jgi:hypothetical protein